MGRIHGRLPSSNLSDTRELLLRGLDAACELLHTRSSGGGINEQVYVGREEGVLPRNQVVCCRPETAEAKRKTKSARTLKDVACVLGDLTDLRQQSHHLVCCNHVLRMEKERWNVSHKTRTKKKK